MEMTGILLIRHGLTAGNLEKRYIGRTDEPLCSEGISQLKTHEPMACDMLVCSPMKRCLQTAEILFPQNIPFIAHDLRECDFGDFEGKNYRELSDSADYQKWIDSGGSLPFPKGESPDDFRRRCTEAFETVIRTCPEAHTVAFVVHGGTIMSILEKYALPHMDYFCYQCENGHGYSCLWNGKNLEIRNIL